VYPPGKNDSPIHPDERMKPARHQQHATRNTFTNRAVHTKATNQFPSTSAIEGHPVTKTQPTRTPRALVVGASADRSKFGNKAVRAHLAKGYEVVAVNPRAAAEGIQIEGVTTVATIRQAPGRFDRATFYVPPEIGIDLIKAWAERPESTEAELWLNPGADDEQLVSLAKSLGLAPIQACSIVDIGGSPHHDHTHPQPH